MGTLSQLMKVASGLRYNQAMQHYISNAKLTAEIISCQPSNTISNELAAMLMTMVEKYARRPNYQGYSFIDDMKCEALMQLLSRNQKRSLSDTRPNVLKFDAGWAERKAKELGTTPLKPNGFAYVTQIIDTTFKRFIKLQRRQQDIKDAMRILADLKPSNRRQSEENDNRSAEPILKKGKPGRKPRNVVLDF